MSHLSQYAKTFKDIQTPHYPPQQLQQQFLDDSENASVGSVENHLDPLHPMMIAKDRPRRNQDLPWKKYLPEQYALPSKDLCEHEDPDHHCEFCGPPAPTNASYLRAYHVSLPSLLE